MLAQYGLLLAQASNQLTIHRSTTHRGIFSWADPRRVSQPLPAGFTVRSRVSWRDTCQRRMAVVVPHDERAVDQCWIGPSHAAGRVLYHEGDSGLRGWLGGGAAAGDGSERCGPWERNGGGNTESLVLSTFPLLLLPQLRALGEEVANRQAWRSMGRTTRQRSGRIFCPSRVSAGHMEALSGSSKLDSRTGVG